MLLGRPAGRPTGDDDGCSDAVSLRPRCLRFAPTNNWMQMQLPPVALLAGWFGCPTKQAGQLEQTSSHRRISLLRLEQLDKNGIVSLARAEVACCATNNKVFKSHDLFTSSPLNKQTNKRKRSVWLLVVKNLLTIQAIGSRCINQRIINLFLSSTRRKERRSEASFYSVGLVEDNLIEKMMINYFTFFIYDAHTDTLTLWLLQHVSIHEASFPLSCD